jgi:tetratricopeptide (TPR) repeat protein
MDDETTLKAFISYRRDNGERDANVLQLSDSLRHDGVAAEIDQYDEERVLLWPGWMQSKVAEAEFVLLICTADYKEIAEMLAPGELARGAGTRWESSQVINEIYRQGHTGKFIPVLLAGSTQADIPYFLEGVPYLDLGEPGRRPDYERLLHKVFSSPRLPAPEIGQRPLLSEIVRAPTESAIRSFQETVADRKEDVALALSAAIRKLLAGATKDRVATAIEAIALARVVLESRPADAVGLFEAVEKPLKGNGDKRRVLEAAEITIDAVRRLDEPTKADVAAEARAKVCGLSWVFQRRGELAKASVFTEEGRAISEKLDQRATTAFAAKCAGRLHRLQGEGCSVSDARNDFFARSRASLEDAIATFSAAEGFGPTHPEVGDCHSLLGRTWLSDGRVDLAAQEADIAEELILNHAEKDYLDLLILRSDILVASGKPREGKDLLTEALKVAAQHHESYPLSEIIARIFESRARAHIARKDGRRAAKDFLSAADIYCDLREHDRENRARFLALKSEQKINPDLDAAISGQERDIRERTHVLYNGELSALGKGAKLRPGISPILVERLVKEAKLQSAVQDASW